MTKLRAVLRRRWPLLLVTAVIGVAAGVASVLAAGDAGPNRYSVDQVVVTSSGDVTAGTSVSRDALKVTRGEVPSLAADLLGVPDQALELLQMISVQSDPETGSITITAIGSDAGQTSDVVQAFTQAFLDVVNGDLRAADQRQLEQLEIQAEEAQQALAAFDDANAGVLRPDAPVPDTNALNALLAERGRLVEVAAAASQRVADFELEIAQSEPYSSLGVETPKTIDNIVRVPQSIPLRAGLLGFVGLLLGIALVVLLERLNRRIDTREELAQLISVPILAEVGHVGGRRDDRERVELIGAWAEGYRRVRSAINFVQADAANRSDRVASAGGGAAVLSRNGVSSEPRVFMFTSALPGEGKSTSTLLTAMALAESGQETLVIDADFRRPTIDKYVGVAASPGLAEMAEMGKDGPGVDSIVQSTQTDGLWVATAGPPTLEVEGRLRAARGVALETARRGGTVLIDSSPLHATNDPVDLLPVVDEVILVVRAGRSTVRSVAGALRTLDMHRAPVLGLVLIGTRAGRAEYSYYDAYSTDLEEPRHSRRRRPLGASENEYGRQAASDPSVPPMAASSQRSTAQGMPSTTTMSPPLPGSSSRAPGRPDSDGVAQDSEREQSEAQVPLPPADYPSGTTPPAWQRDSSFSPPASGQPDPSPFSDTPPPYNAEVRSAEAARTASPNGHQQHAQEGERSPSGPPNPFAR